MKKKKSSSKLAFLIFGFVFIAYVIFISVMPSAPKAPNTSSEIQTYEDQQIDLENLDQYPFGKSLEQVLLKIGVDDAVEAVCEVDNASTFTLRILTSNKRLWVSIDGYFHDDRQVKWVKDYDSTSTLYYYISDRLSLNEPIYSYKTGELLIDKVDGESSSYPIVITTEQLVSEINANIDAAKEKYNGKWVKISGKVTFISQSAGMTGYYLYGKRGSEGLKITCWVDNQYAASLLSVGVTVTFVGQMREVTIMNNTEIADCKVIK